MRPVEHVSQAFAGEFPSDYSATFRQELRVNVIDTVPARDQQEPAVFIGEEYRAWML